MNLKKFFIATLVLSLTFTPKVFASCTDYYSQEDYDYIVKNTDPNDLDLSCSNGTLFTDEYLNEVDENLSNSDPIPMPRYFVSKLSVQPHKQVNGYYCGPANIQMIVEYLNGSADSQYTYASYMNTDAQGETYVYQMVNALNHYTSKSYSYIQGNNYNASTFSTLVKNKIQENKPIVLHAYTASLYMYNGVGLGHYLTVNGYTYTSSFGDDTGINNIYYVDPYDKVYSNGNVYGEHMDTTSNVYNTVAGERYIIQ